MQERLGERAGEDDIEASKAPLMDHLIELRQRLIYSVGAFLVMFLLCFMVARHIYNVLVWPYIWASGDQQVRLIATHFLEQLFTHIKLAMFGAAFLSFPVVATQVYKFVAPGLYRNERRAFLPYLSGTTSSSCWRGGGLLPRHADPDPLFDRADAGGGRRPGGNRADAEGLRIPVADHDAHFGFGIMFQLPVVLTLLARGS